MKVGKMARGLQIATGVSAFALYAPAVFAQEKDASTQGVAEIVVTAQFREQRLQDTPLAITAVNAKTLEARGNANLQDVVKAAPNVVLIQQPQAFGPSIAATIRGLGQGDLDPAYEPGVGLYIDDVYYPRLTGANFDLMDVDRVEILRGPQGTLTGRDSEGGAIKFYSRKPDGKGGGYVESTYGSRNLIKLRAAADFTIADNLFARISGTFTRQEGYVKTKNFACDQPAGGVSVPQQAKSCTVGTMGGLGNQAVRGLVRYAPNDIVDIMLSGDYSHEEHGGSAEVLLYGSNANPNVLTTGGVPLDSRFICGRYCNYDTFTAPALASFTGFILPGVGPIPYSVYTGLAAIPGNPTGVFPTSLGPLSEITGSPTTVYDGWGVSGTVKLNLSDDINVTSITGYRQWSTRFTADQDLSPANTGLGLNELHDKFFSEELRANVKLGEIAEATVGGYYSREESLYWTLQDIRYAPIPLQFIGDDPINTNSKAVFGTVIVRPLKGLTFTGGLRYTKEHKDYTFHRYAVDGVTPNMFLGALNGLVGVYDGHRTDYRVSLDYRFSPEILVYGTVSTGFKGGGVSPRPFNAAQVLPFNPETVTTYEAGIKTDLFDRHLRFNATAFYNQFKDAQLTLLTCPQYGGAGPCALTQNAGNAHQKGLEFELLANPLNGLTIDASASYLHYKYTCVVPQVVGLSGTDCSSDPAVLSQLADFSSGWKWAAGAQYLAQLGGNRGSLTPRIDVTHEARLVGNNVLRPATGSPSDLYAKIPAYTLVNLRLTWENSNHDLSATFAVNNLLDKYYFVTTFDFTSAAGANTISGLPGRPREWSFTIKKKF